MHSALDAAYFRASSLRHYCKLDARQAVAA
jgi:hypothetical protein